MNGNTILASLPPALSQRLIAQGQRMRVPRLTVLCDEGEPFDYAYFPLSGMASLISTTVDGDTVEVASIGREGMIGIQILLPEARAPYAVHVLLPADVIRVRAAALRGEVKASSLLYETLVAYLHTLSSLMSQTAVCHRFHSARQRLCRWLLSALDRADGNVLELTQEVIGQSLGIPRTGVTTIAVELQDCGAIRCRHGRITVLNRTKLEAIACPCHHGAAFAQNAQCGTPSPRVHSRL
jgi:CRP-like cAMP-binding protein